MVSKICPICGRVFYPAVMHRYKRLWRGKTYTTCSYKCYTKLLECINKISEHDKRIRVNKSLDNDISGVL